MSGEAGGRATETKWFGIGCFHFSYNKKAPFVFRIADYANLQVVPLSTAPPH
jgi:hypothetical protein